MKRITKAQQQAIKRIYLRGQNNGLTYLQFRRSVKQGYDCLMVHWCGMWLGIETDGHTHS
jgi:hypothetical protein